MNNNLFVREVQLGDDYSVSILKWRDSEGKEYCVGVFSKEAWMAERKDSDPGRNVRK